MRRQWRSLFLLSVVAAVAACDQSPVGTIDLPKPQFGKSIGQAVRYTFEAPTIADVASAIGISGDGAGAYVDKVLGVQAYLGTTGISAILVTYNTPRTLRYAFDPQSAAWIAAQIPAINNSVTDFYGQSRYGRFEAQAVGSVAMLEGTFQFYIGNVTYELKYANLALQRLNPTEWLITSDCARLNDQAEPVCYDYGFTPSAQADLNVVRRKARAAYGKVNMPVTFHVVLL